MTETDDMQHPQGAEGRFLSWLLVCVGSVWLLLTGGCSAMLVVLPFLYSLLHGELQFPWSLLIVAAVSILPGVLMLRAGLRRLRRQPALRTLARTFEDADAP